MVVLNSNAASVAFVTLGGRTLHFRPIFDRIFEFALENRIFPGSAMVAQLPVKELVVGSSPTQGARLFKTMHAARPAARSAFSFHEFCTGPLDSMVSCFQFLGRFDPAYPLIARERSDALPCRLGRFGSGKGFLQICRHLVCNATGEFFFCHEVILPNFQTRRHDSKPNPLSRVYGKVGLRTYMPAHAHENNNNIRWNFFGGCRGCGCCFRFFKIRE